jgi:hypothetical protein
MASVSFWLVAGSASVAILVLSVVQRGSTVSLAGERWSYWSPLVRWEIDLSSLRAVDVPTNYRLFYVVFETDDGRRKRLPILNFKAVPTLARALLESLPPETVSDLATRALEALAAGTRPDRISRR